MERLERCTRAKPGWHCTRAAGHDGPCAAEQDHLLPPDADDEWGSTADGARIVAACVVVACVVAAALIALGWGLASWIAS